jgi:hypothetical protein
VIGLVFCFCICVAWPDKSSLPQLVHLQVQPGVVGQVVVEEAEEAEAVAAVEEAILSSWPS